MPSKEKVLAEIDSWVKLGYTYVPRHDVHIAVLRALFRMYPFEQVPYDAPIVAQLSEAREEIWDANASTFTSVSYDKWESEISSAIGGGKFNATGVGVFYRFPGGTVNVTEYFESCKVGLDEIMSIGRFHAQEIFSVITVKVYHPLHPAKDFHVPEYSLPCTD